MRVVACVGIRVEIAKQPAQTRAKRVANRLEDSVSVEKCAQIRHSGRWKVLLLMGKPTFSD